MYISREHAGSLYSFSKRKDTVQPVSITIFPFTELEKAMLLNNGYWRAHALLKNTARFLTLNRPNLTSRLLFRCMESLSEQQALKGISEDRYFSFFTV